MNCTPLLHSPPSGLFGNSKVPQSSVLVKANPHFNLTSTQQQPGPISNVPSGGFIAPDTTGTPVNSQQPSQTIFEFLESSSQNDFDSYQTTSSVPPKVPARLPAPKTVSSLSTVPPVSQTFTNAFFQAKPPESPVTDAVAVNTHPQNEHFSTPSNSTGKQISGGHNSSGQTGGNPNWQPQANAGRFAPSPSQNHTPHPRSLTAQSPLLYPSRTSIVPPNHAVRNPNTGKMFRGPVNQGQNLPIVPSPHSQYPSHPQQDPLARAPPVTPLGGPPQNLPTQHNQAGNTSFPVVPPQNKWALCKNSFPSPSDSPSFRSNVALHSYPGANTAPATIPNAKQNPNANVGDSLHFVFDRSNSDKYSSIEISFVTFALTPLVC